MARALPSERVREKLPPEWEFDGDSIVRTVEFETYEAGVDFAVDVAALAEAADHHPRIVIEFRAVTIELTSHDAGGVTERDLHLAAEIDSL